MQDNCHCHETFESLSRKNIRGPLHDCRQFSLYIFMLFGHLHPTPSYAWGKSNAREVKIATSLSLDVDKAPDTQF